MTELLYQKDMHLYEFEATVTAVEGNKIELDRTAFYPQSGGIATDTGTIGKAGEVFKVVFVKKEGPRIIHELDRSGITVGEKIVGKVDSARRKILARYHTAAHLLIALINRDVGALSTGNSMDVEGGRLDVDWDGFDKEKLEEIFGEANELVKKNASVRVYYLPRSELDKKPELVKIAMGLPPHITEVRMVEIAGIDNQPDGGCHVDSLSEIGRLELLGTESKGKKNRRLKFVLRDS
jgi:misacylated tRNA(Ala) deacylase